MDGGAKFDNSQPKPDTKKPPAQNLVPDISFHTPPQTEKPALSEREILLKAAVKNREVRTAVLEGKYSPSQVEHSDLPEDWKEFFRNLVTIVRTDMDATQRIVGTAQQRLNLAEASEGRTGDGSLAKEVYRMACDPPKFKVDIKGKIELIRRPSVSILILRDPSDLDKIGVRRDPNTKTEDKAEGTYVNKRRFYLNQDQTVEAPLIVIYSGKPINELELTINEELLHHTYRHTSLADAKAKNRDFVEEDSAVVSVRLGFEIDGIVIQAKREGVTDEIRSKFERLLDGCDGLSDSFAANELFANITNSPIARMEASPDKGRLTTLTTGMDIEILSDRSAYSPWRVLFPDIDRFPEELKRMVNERKSKFNATVRQAIDSAEDGFFSMLYLNQGGEVFESYYLLLQRYPMAEWEARLGILMGENLPLYREHLKDIDGLKFQCVMLRERAEALHRGEDLSDVYYERAKRFGKEKKRIAGLYKRMSDAISKGANPRDAIAQVGKDIDKLKTYLSK